MGIEGQETQEGILYLLIPQSIKNHLLKVAFDTTQVTGIDVYTLFCNYKSTEVNNLTVFTVI